VKPVEVTIGGVRMRVEPTGSVSPQRTESLARELIRGLMGTNAAPTIEVVRGPGAGSKRDLPPPEATWIIGRGDEATWVLLDEDLSREHVELVRGWDGVTIRDLGSKNGTRVDGVKIAEPTMLRDGAKIELGNCELVFRDPAERHLHGELMASAPAAVQPDLPTAPTVIVEAPGTKSSRMTFGIAAVTCAVAMIALVWVLAS